MKKRRILKWLAGVAGVLSIAFLALVLILPRLVDSEAAKEKIRLVLSEKTGGSFAFDKIDFLWLPRPAVVIRGVKISIAEHSAATIQSVRVQPSIVALAAGRWALARVVLEKPAVAARLAEWPDKPLSAEEIEKTIRGWLAALLTPGPRLVVRIDNGSAEIAIGKRPPVSIKNLDAQLVGLRNEVEIEIAARSNLWDKLRVEGKITGDKLVTDGTISIERIRLREAMASLLPRPLEYVEGGEVNLALRLASAGMRKIAVQVDGSLPSLALARGGAKAVVEARRLKGTVTYDNGGIRVVIERLDLVSPNVGGSEDAAGASDDAILHPISIRKGTFDYQEGKISLAGLTGTFGRSSFSGLAGQVKNDAQRNFEISAGSLSLDLEEFKDFLLRYEAHRKTFAGVKSARGRLNVASLFVAGPLDDPAEWNFSAAGSVESLSVNHASLPAPLTVARARFAATPAKLTLSDAETEILDARLTVGGSLEKSQKAPLTLDAAATGVVGAQMKEWLGRQAGLPEQLALRAPLKVGAGRVRWSEGGDLSFIGNFTVANGPKVSVDAVRSRQAVTVRELTLEDGAQRARMALKVEKDEFNLSFKGAVDQAMLNKIFQSLPLPGGFLQGDFEARGSLKQPQRFFARGKLEGKNLVVPLKKKPAVVESFLLEAGAGGVTIRSAALRWQDSRLLLSGKLGAEKEAIRVDMDISADRLAWDAMSEAMGREDDKRADQGAKTMPMPVILGTVRLKTDSFTFEHFNLSPLRMTADISSSGIRAEIAQGVACGITATGRVGIAGKEIELDVQLSATEAQLEPTTICLSGKQQDIKGIYSLKARIAGRGDRERLLPSLKGNFELSARDGEFVHSPTMDATFDYLNATGDFKVAFPDLNKQTFPYRRLSVKGAIDGENIVTDEFIIEASPYTITGQARLDLRLRQIDAKGLVSVAMSTNQVIRSIPVIGAIIGGSLVGIPVRVTGSIDRPDVTYLSAADVGTELLNMPTRILGIPLETMKLFTPSQPQPGKE